MGAKVVQKMSKQALIVSKTCEILMKSEYFINNKEPLKVSSGALEE
jgi:hypothetical protein